MAISGKDKKYEVKGRIWVELHGETFIGIGKICLLRKTAELGSLRKAASEMKMSYRQAWYTLNRMNKAAPASLVVLKRGGKNGGIAEITRFGEEVLRDFENLEKEFAEFLERQTQRLNE
jgi:molybdate transport system regulatory protein